MRIYASLHDDIGEGFVWLEKPGLPSRCVVRISGPENRTVYCEALQLDANFVKRYNNDCRHTIADPKSSIVMSGWYRARLGELQTQQDYALEVERVVSWRGKLCACKHHPQLVIRVAFWLAMLSVVLGVLGVLLGVASIWS